MIASDLQLASSGSEAPPPVAQAIPVRAAEVVHPAADEDAAARAGRRRLRWWIAGGMALGLALASFSIVLASSVYEARSSVLIRPPGGSAGVPQAVGGALQSEVEILRSFEVLRQALESIGVEVLYPGLEGESTGALRALAVARMRDALGVRTLPGSDVIEVTFRHRDAALAAGVVNRLVERYRRSRREMLAPAVSRRLLFERTAEQREALAAAETALAAFHAEHPELAAPDPRRALADRRLTVEGELRRQRELARAVQGEAIQDDPSLGRARARLDELELELQGTLNTHVEGSRAVTKARSEIARVREYAAGQEQRALRERRRELELLGSRQRELEAELAGLARVERELAALELRARELARERDVAARRLGAYQRELEAAALAADLGVQELAVTARVLEPAQAPAAVIVPAERARQAWALVGVALAVVLGAFVADVLDPRGGTGTAPVVWTAHVGAGAGAGPVAVLLPSSRRGEPAVMLLAGAADGTAEK